LKIGYDFSVEKIIRNQIVLVFLFLLGGQAWAGTTLKARLQSFAYPQAWADLNVSIDQNKMRVDFKGPWSNGSLIYDRDTSLLVVVDGLHQAVFSIPLVEQTTLKLLGTVAVGLAEGKLGKGDGTVRPFYRIITENVGALFNGTPRLKAKGVPMAGLTCDEYVTNWEGHKAREVWVTAPEKAGMSLEDFDTFRGLAHLALDLFGDGLAQLGADPAAYPALFLKSELPALSILYARGKPSSRFEIVSLRPQSFAPGSFDPPAEYPTMGLLDILKK
jgi:hypothetical protein